MLSERVQRIGMSPTMKVAGTAKKMIAEGIDVVDLSVGEPDFNTPENIKTAGIHAIETNNTRYTPNAGMAKLKAAIIHRFAEDHNLAYQPDEILVSPGAKNSLYNLCAAIFSPGDEAIIPAPYWVSYPSMVALTDAKSVFVETNESDGFRMTPEALKGAITPKTKALFLNNPSNPSGAFYEREQLEKIVRVAVDAGLVIISDEIYEKLIYDGATVASAASFGPEAKKHTVVINGVSKAYAMTGWRIGYAAGDKALISSMSKIQSHNTSCASAISQMATIEALAGPQTSITTMVKEFQARRDYLHQALTAIPGISCHKSKGAFYLFPKFSAYFGKTAGGQQILNSSDMCLYLLETAHVAIVPGSAFGAEGFVRFSYANSLENLQKAVTRILGALQKLQ